VEWRALMQTRRTRFLPKALAVEFRRLPWRLLGLWLFALAVAGWLALLSWSFVDPSPSNATKVPPHNLLGYQGASFAAFMMEGFGLASPFLVLPLAAFGIQIASGHMPLKPRLRLAFWGAALMFAPAFFASLRAPSSWPVRNGLGGMFGDFVTAGVSRLSGAVPPPLLWPLSALVFLVLGGWCVWHASGLSVADFLLAFQGESAIMAAAPGDFREPASSGGFVRRLTNWVRRLPASDRAPRGPREFWMTQARTEPTLAPPPAAKPSKRESEVAEAAVAEVAADVEPLFFGVPAKQEIGRASCRERV
jgi:S-DNA-T family DNA segregation ATPase FtsK/SpoIIIE